MKIKMPRVLAFSICMLAAVMMRPQAWGQAAESEEGTRRERKSAAQGNGYRAPTLKESFERSKINGTRKINIQPIKQSTGIATGLVMAYGHIIPPPYKIEWKDNRLLVNGVQVDPPLVWERQRPMLPKFTPEEERRNRRQEEVRKAIREIYSSNRGKKLLRDIQQEITDLVMKSSGAFINPVWHNENSLRMEAVGWPTYSPVTIVFNSLPPMTPAAEEKQRNGHRREAIRRVQLPLEMGYVKIYMSDGAEGYYETDFRKAVNEIMNAPDLTKEQRFEQLKERVFPEYNNEAVLDIIENYDPVEWEVK